jgi:hypothetical protein
MHNNEWLLPPCILIYRALSSNLMSNLTVKAFAAGLLLLFLITATSAYAQPAMPKEVSGTYVNADAGVQVTFPDGWSGFEIATPAGTLVTTSQGGLSESDPQTMTTIGLIISDKSQNKDPRDPRSFTNDANACNDPTITSRTVAGVQGIEASVECPSTSQTMRMVSVQTDSNWIVMMYTAPTANFQSQVAAFDSAVSSLQVQGAVNTEAGGAGGSGGNGNSGGTNLGLELKAVIQSVLVKGKNVDLHLNTTSTISNFKLQEQNKALSFTVDGQSGTQGTTVIPIGKVLEGPYTVAIDGQSTTNFEVTNEGTSNAMLKVMYTHSTHDITVTGTNVVPEFPLVAIGAIAAVIGVVAIIGRTSLFGKTI